MQSLMTDSLKHIHNIAVVMTTYNGDQFLTAQIDSILNQSLAPNLFIVCDDGSIDNTTSILNKFQAEGKLKWHANKKQLGVAANFKNAISLVPDGYYFALADQDDIWDKDKLALSMEQMLLMEKKEIPCLVYSNLRLIDAGGNILNESFQNELGHDKYLHTLDTLLFGNFVLGCTCLCNNKMKAYMTKMPTSIAFNHDAWIALVAYAIGVATPIKKSLVSYRKHNNNITISSHLKKKRLQLYFTHLKGLFCKNDFLKERLILVDEFVKIFFNNLTEINAVKLNDFLALRKKSYWKKKLAFEKAFSGKWVKRFS
jgi:glycosyltransferase involved in cell wall biosynthesis